VFVKRLGDLLSYDRYWIDLAIDAQTRAEYYGLLSPDECDRAARLLNLQHQNDFIAARGVLRSTLAQYTNCSPRALRFEYGNYGKPRLVDYPNLQFNLAHSNGRALIVVSETAVVGVDLEKVRSVPKLLELAKRFFKSSEYDAIVALPESLQPAQFFAYWTCKEAYLKAVGIGLSQISNLELHIDESSVTVVKSPCDRIFNLTRFDLTCLDSTAIGFVGAVAIESV
jgi:4'-phosphopantetheinyl transferase